MATSSTSKPGVRFVADKQQTRSKTFLLRLRPQEHDFLMAEARKQDVSASEFIRMALDEFIGK